MPIDQSCIVTRLSGMEPLRRQSAWPGPAVSLTPQDSLHCAQHTRLPVQKRNHLALELLQLQSPNRRKAPQQAWEVRQQADSPPGKGVCLGQVPWAGCTRLPLELLRCVQSLECNLHDPVELPVKSSYWEVQDKYFNHASASGIITKRMLTYRKQCRRQKKMQLASGHRIIRKSQELNFS